MSDRVDWAEAGEAILKVARRTGALAFGEFTLSAGGTSPYYFDGRLVTLDPEGAYHIAAGFLPVLRDCGAEIVAGPAVAAVPIVSAVAYASFIDGLPIPGMIVRQEVKGHGTQRGIEGSIRTGARVAVVDDTCSTGASLLRAVEAVEAAGCPVVKVVCILDRHLGGSDEIQRRGYDFVALLEADEDGEIRPPQS